MEIEIRLATAADHAALGHVMYEAVRHSASPYTEAQRQAWMPEPRSGAEWDARLGAQTVLVATQGEEIVGFMSLAAEGYIDFAYIRPAAQGQGIFRRLYEEIEALARERGGTRLWVHASLMAQPAFAAMGFVVTQPETVAVRGQSLDRFAMEKVLS